MLENGCAFGQNISAEKSGSPAARIEDDSMLALSEKSISLLHNKEIPSRKDIERLQEAMLPIQCEQPIPEHHFCPGVYARELVVPAGMLIVGKIHKHDHFIFVLSGKAEVASEFGKELVEAGHFSISKAGVKRVVLALEDTRFVTIHHNSEDSQDLSVIEDAHIEHEHKRIFEVMP